MPLFLSDLRSILPAKWKKIISTQYQSSKFLTYITNIIGSSGENNCMCVGSMSVSLHYSELITQHFTDRIGTK